MEYGTRSMSPARLLLAARWLFSSDTAARSPPFAARTLFRMPNLPCFSDLRSAARLLCPPSPLARMRFPYCTELSADTAGNLVEAETLPRIQGADHTG